MKSNASSIVSRTFVHIRIIYRLFFIRTTRLGSWLTKEHCRKRTMTRSSNYTLSTASPSRQRWNNSLPKPALTSAHIYSPRAIACPQQNRQNRLPSKISKCTLSSNQERKRKLRRWSDPKGNFLRAHGCAEMQLNAHLSKWLKICNLSRSKRRSIHSMWSVSRLLPPMTSLVTHHHRQIKWSYSTLNASQSHPKLDQVRTRTESRPPALE